MSIGHTYKFFGFYISYTIFTLPLSIFHLSSMLLIHRLTFLNTPPPLPTTLAAFCPMPGARSLPPPDHAGQAGSGAEEQARGGPEDAGRRARGARVTFSSLALSLLSSIRPFSACTSSLVPLSTMTSSSWKAAPHCREQGRERRSPGWTAAPRPVRPAQPQPLECLGRPLLPCPPRG